MPFYCFNLDIFHDTPMPWSCFCLAQTWGQLKDTKHEKKTPTMLFVTCDQPAIYKSEVIFTLKIPAV